MRLGNLFLLVVLLSSCGPVIRYYEPVKFNGDFKYIPKPISFDSIHTSNYITAGYGGKSLNNLDESAGFAELSIFRSHYLNKMNFAYGANGYVGTYSASPGRDNYNQAQVINKLGFSGLQLHSSTNFVTSSGRTDFRIIGLEIYYNKEFGNYNKFRNTISNEPNNYSITESSFLSGGLSTEIIWHSKKSIHNQIGLKMAIGSVLGNYKYKGDFTNIYTSRAEANNLAGSLSFFFQLQKFNLIFEQSSVSHINVGYRF